ncbi:hypothetical protein [Methylobacterium frigidaeris]|uniref:Phage tail lysozyme domain-containing protein n=1 Tax=Methylobacterium frigidaeris TaxID=2038277 RepID=A0AA37HEJ8_9HYPH|nr:hypothetical protein [Methylobacterium frigidaeris]GJD63750.1 hypothetical protein MPEAHAMD_3921 [Methylobacterium frigidaeris]
MATVVDRLVVELGLDPKAFAKGQKEAAAALVRTRQQAEKEGKGIEKAMDDAGAAFDRLARNALKLFALFTAGRGIGQFVRDITGADAALGRLSTSIGRAPELISAMSKAVERSGGDAQAAARSFQTWSEQVEQIRTTGDSSILPFLARLQAAGGKTIDLNKKNVDGLADLADNLKAVAEQQGIASATYYGKNLGFDEGTIALMVKGGAALRAAIAESEKLGIATRKDTEAAQALSTAYVTLTQEVESFGRTILTAVSPVLVQLLKDIQAIVRAVKEWVQANVVPFLREFADAMGVAGSETKTLVRITEALFALWLGSKALAFLRVLGTMRLLLTGGRVAAGGALAGSSGLLGAIIGGLAVGGTIGADRSTPNAEKPGLQKNWDDEASGAAPGGMWGALKRGWNWGKGKLFGGGSASAAPGAAGTAAAGVGGEPGVRGRPDLLNSGGASPEVVDYIRQRASALGIDPDTAVAVANTEGLRGYKLDGKKDGGGDNGMSFGPYQLYYGGGLGNEFSKKHPGLHASDKSTYKQQVDFALEHAAKNGWGSWYGARNNGIGNWAGIGGRAGVKASTGPQTAGDVPGANGVGAVEQRQHGATRSQPITTELRRQLAAAAVASGVNAEIFSGGQDSSGPNRVGSHRHDNGRSADLKLYQVGPDGKRRYLRHDNDADRAVMERFLRESVKEGANGIGAGPGYMGPDRMHVGGGSEAAWGAGGSTANAPDWVSRALREGLAARKKKTAEWWRGSPNAMASVTQSRDAQAAQAARISNDNRSSSSVRNNSTINGGVHVHTAATDANGITRDMEDALKRRSLAAAANYGQA